MKTMDTAINHRDTKYRYIPQNESLWVLCDFGNKDIKAMVHANFGEEIWFPNYIYYLSDDEAASQASAYKHRPAEFEQSAIFSVDGRAMVVGAVASERSGSIQKKGADKYGDYIRHLFIASMLQLYPEGHKKVSLVVTHPAKLPISEIEALKESFSGRMNVMTVDGREVVYVVRNVVMIEEPIAAFQTYALNVNGNTHQRRDFKLAPGMKFAICDVGGYISHLALGSVNSKGGIEIAAINLEPIEYGIHQVIKTFEYAAKSQITELRKMNSLDIERVNMALKTDVYRVGRSISIAVEKQVEDAFKPLMTKLEENYHESPFRDGTGLDGVILTGGGNALAHEYLSRNLFNVREEGFAVPAEDEVEQMRFCSIRGASKGLIPFLAQLEYRREKKRA